MADQERLGFREQTGRCHDPEEREALRAIQAMAAEGRSEPVATLDAIQACAAEALGWPDTPGAPAPATKPRLGSAAPNAGGEDE